MKIDRFDQKHTLIEAMHSGINLFVGAGFSVHAKDYEGKRLPLGCQLLQELHSIVYQNAESTPTLMGYRMQILDNPEQAAYIQKRITHFLEIVNKLFADSHKTIEIVNSQLAVKQNNEYLSLDKLSSGEKQMLLITLKTFLTHEQPAVLFMDEPEISMHITWQNQLIDVLRELNPNAQLFITTHSPSVLSKGWGDKITYMEDITD